MGRASEPMTQSTQFSAAIAGGGIAGLSTAIALMLGGWQVSVYERAPALGEVGAGLQLGPNGSALLDALGVLPLLEDQLFEPRAVELRLGRSGRRIMRMDLSDAQSRWGGRYVLSHRADLIAALQARAEALQPGFLHTGAQASGYGPGRLFLHGGGEVKADLVIGADGLHSCLRRQMHGPQAPRFTGNVAWRGTVPLTLLQQAGGPIPPENVCAWTGPRKHAVTNRVRAGQVVNFVGIVEQDSWQDEGWSLPGTTAEALADFGDWNPVLTAVIEAAPSLFRWALFDRAPLASWSDGATVLLGDAAHPMLPSMAQGAVQAIEDAVELAACLAPVSGAGDIPLALRRFSDHRGPRTARVQAQSAANLRLFHREGLAQVASYGPIWLADKLAPWAIKRRNDWVYGHRAGQGRQRKGR